MTSKTFLRAAYRCRSVEMLDRIRLLILDVDGVLTDGRITYTSRGTEVKSFHTLDGHGVKLWVRQGKDVALVSGRASGAIRRRAKEIGVEAVYEGAKDKLPVFEKVLKRFRCAAGEACYVGDDLPDVPVLARVGFAVAVPGAVGEVKRVSHYVTRAVGGGGAVREVVELILRHPGLGGEATRRYAEGLPADLPAARNPWGGRQG